MNADPGVVFSGKANAERQRKYRLRRDADENRRQKYLEKSREKYRKKKEEGKIKSVKDMSDKERREIRKIWRNNKRLSRNKKTFRVFVNN